MVRRGESDKDSSRTQNRDGLEGEEELTKIVVRKRVGISVDNNIFEVEMKYTKHVVSPRLFSVIASELPYIMTKGVL